MKKIKPTKEQIEIMKEYWELFKIREELFYDDVYELEDEMAKMVGIEDLEFFQCDGSFCGIGNASRTLDLIPSEKLEKK